MGVTSVADMSADGDVGLYQYMLERGELKTRIYAMRSIVSWETLAKTGVRGAFGSDMLRIGGLKGFADGSLGSTTAFFFEPYNDAPDTRGLLFDQMLPEGIMLKRVEGADKAGLQVLIHAIGDEANLRILEIYQQAAEKNGPRDRRFRIEHAQHLRPSEIARFGTQKVIASMQPYHAADDGRWCEKRIGPERSKGTYAFRSLLDSRRGARLRLRLDGRPAKSAGRAQGRRDPPDARRQASWRLDAGAEAYSGPGHPRIYYRLGVCRIRRQSQRHYHTREACRLGHA